MKSDFNRHFLIYLKALSQQLSVRCNKNIANVDISSRRRQWWVKKTKTSWDSSEASLEVTSRQHKLVWCGYHRHEWRRHDDGFIEATVARVSTGLVEHIDS